MFGLIEYASPVIIHRRQIVYLSLPTNEINRADKISLPKYTDCLFAALLSGRKIPWCVEKCSYNLPWRRPNRGFDAIVNKFVHEESLENVR